MVGLWVLWLFTGRCLMCVVLCVVAMRVVCCVLLFVACCLSFGVSCSCLLFSLRFRLVVACGSCLFLIVV